MAKHRSVFVRINRRYPWVKVLIFSMVITMVMIEVGIGGVRGGQMMAKLADMSIEQKYNDTLKIDLGGEEVEVSGVEEFEEQVNKEVEQQPVEKDLTGKQLVALTFDDGPDAEVTGKILDILKEKDVKATFFMVGIMVQRTPETAKRVADEGHEVETHSLRHANLSQMNWDSVAGDIEQSRQIIRDATGVEVGILRPPYGMVNETVKGAAGMPMMAWSVDPDDWRDRNAGLVKDRVVNAGYDGAIILLHDIYSTTAEAVPWIIDELRERGFEFVTVKELAEKRGITLNVGDIYRDFAN